MLRAAGALAAFSVPLALALHRSSRSGDRTSPSGEKPSLVPDARGLCDLPPGFQYEILESTPALLSDGHRVPASPDGMGCFPGSDGNWILMRNHELDHDLSLGPFSGSPPREAYDPAAAGCVTRLVVHPPTLQRISSNLVLCGTLRNCAGGISPWGWLSCEESVSQGHGYVFLCSTKAAVLERPRKISGYGRFNHEAVCIDPETHVAYLTEDRSDGCLYRFVPVSRERPFEGRLQALALRGAPRLDTGVQLAAGEVRRATWVPLLDTHSVDDSLRFQARERGAAQIRRGEGIWFHEGSVYFSATSGGARGAGQILRLAVGRSGADDTLEVLVESGDTDQLDAPDNLTLAPWGDVYIAEDGPGAQFLRRLTRAGRMHTFARNARSGGEFAGLCFSPDGKVLFVNFQREAITIAIRGPFQRTEA